MIDIIIYLLELKLQKKRLWHTVPIECDSIIGRYPGLFYHLYSAAQMMLLLFLLHFMRCLECDAIVATFAAKKKVTAYEQTDTCH